MQGVCGRYGTRLPGENGTLVRRRHQFKPEPIRIAKPHHALAEAFFVRCDAEAVSVQSLGPECQRLDAYRERDRDNLTGTDDSAPGAGPRKERQDGSWRAALVSEIEVIRTRIVEIDRELDKSEPHHLRVEIQVPLGIGRNGSDVVNAWYGLHGHRDSPGGGGSERDTACTSASPACSATNQTWCRIASASIIFVGNTGRRDRPHTGSSRGTVGR